MKLVDITSKNANRCCHAVAMAHFRLVTDLLSKTRQALGIGGISDHTTRRLVVDSAQFLCLHRRLNDIIVFFFYCHNPLRQDRAMSAEHHEGIKTRSYKLLDDARKAKYNGHYDSEGTRQRITNILKEKMDGKEPYPWQLDVSEAIHMKLDTVVIAGTGAGKTLPFIIPVLLGGMVVIISPLNALQEDQVRGIPLPADN